MREKVGLCLFLVRSHGSDEDGAEIGGRGGRLRHGNLLDLARNSDGSRSRRCDRIYRRLTSKLNLGRTLSRTSESAGAYCKVLRQAIGTGRGMSLTFSESITVRALTHSNCKRACQFLIQ